MMNALSISLIAVLALAPSAGAKQPPAPEPQAAATDGELDLQLKQAEALYESSVAKFKAGDVEGGRAELKKALDIVVDNIDEDTLPASLHSDFAGMLDKIRAADDWQYTDESPNLDPVSLSSAAVSTTPVAMQGIRIDPDNPLTQRFLDMYARRRRSKSEEALAHSGRYRDMMLAALKEKGLPLELFYLVMAESEYKSNALSRSKAAGLWQFMPQTARKYGLEVSYWVDERYSPEKATQAAVHYLADLYQWFGDWNLAIAAYNRGEGGLGRDMQFSRSLDFNSLAGRNALPNETHQYVPKFMACTLLGQNPEKYGLHPEYEAPEPYDLVALPKDLDLGIAAKCAETTEAVIHRLNPELRAWCTPKDRPGFELRIPKGSKDAFQANLAKVQDWNPGPTLVRYRVRRGDVLGKIAKMHHTTVQNILETNRIRNPRMIHPGLVLVIRPGRPARGRSSRGRHLALNKQG